ncbi:MAG: 3-deoxy-D-manno-octulosonic acid transferase [Bacteroidales bacterium]|nr:3-deoxy-D-manno-octulosonic acid transferase [Bacteroidales bacterium]
MKFLYNSGILLFILAVRLLSPFNSKVRLMVKGWKDWEEKLKERAGAGSKNIWVHCASLGEFEQGRPVIEEIRSREPQSRIILSFFSSSGYEIRKNYIGADYVCYLPPDTPGNAERFVKAANPSAVIFVKYEFWNNYISEVRRKSIPLYLISGIFRPGQHFFSWYGGFFRKMLSCFTYIFVQDQKSESLLRSAGINNVTVAGDTRFDRVVEIASSAKDIGALETFRGNARLVLAGSSWPPDEEIIARYIHEHPGAAKWVFAPHEIDESNIKRLEKLLGKSVVRFSEFTEDGEGAEVMIIDNMGMLSSAYRYAYIAVVGGGFGKGIHNVLEPACWGKPVLFGPNHGKFREAVELITEGGGKVFTDYNDFRESLNIWLSDIESYRKAARSAGEYVKTNSGATATILKQIL